jgi:DMSO reductase family type II enzyme chaperone
VEPPAQPMSQSVLNSLDSEEQRLTAARSRAYGLFMAAFDYPVGEACELIRSGELAAGFRDTLTAIDPALAVDPDDGALADVGDDDALAIEYTRLFDAGAGGPPCPLYGGVYGGARMKAMEEAVRFYNHFGLKLSESPRELPDHLSTELEFMHYLTYRETEALQQGDDPGPYQRAQRDFLQRNLLGWIRQLHARLEKQEAMRFFSTAVGALVRFIEHEHGYLVALVGPAGSGKGSRS